MSTSPEVEEIVTLPVTDVMPESVPHLVPEPAPPIEEPAQAKAEIRRHRPPWLATAVLGGAAIVASVTLGYVADAAAQQRNTAYDAYVTTRSALAHTSAALTQARADAATKKVTADYAALFVLDEGKVQMDYQSVQACSSYGTCRTASQNLLTDLQTFQTDRTKAAVPANLGGADASLGDAVSAAIAADDEVIDGMDTFSDKKFTDGLHKLDAAMLGMAKAQVALGTGLQ